jgi:hypothetical protein
MAVWFVFNSKIDLDGEARNLPDSLRDMLYNDRFVAFRMPHVFKEVCDQVPTELEHICLWLNWMRNKLRSAYKEFEKTFDGSTMLSVATDLRKGLQRMEHLARDVNTALPDVRMNRTRNEADQVVQCLEIREELLVGDGVEETSQDDKVAVDCVVGSGGGPSLPVDDPFISGPPTAEPGAERPKFAIHSNKRIRDPSPNFRDPSRAVKIRIKLPDGP